MNAIRHQFGNALVLSGGNIKGAFQAGAIATALKNGFVPDAIYGISVGGLNGAFLADRAGRAAKLGKTVDWPAIGEELVAFWKREIRTAGDIAKKKGILGILSSFLFQKWSGLTDSAPIRDLVHREIALENIRSSPVYFACGTTDLNTGKIFYADYTNSGARLLEFVVASAAIPFLMPQVLIRRSDNGEFREDAYIDGAARDSSPLGIAIDNGATHVLGIYCHPEHLDLKPNLDHRNFRDYAERVMDILSNEQIVNDHKIGMLINALLKSGADNSPGAPLEGKRVIRGLQHVIRPEKEIPWKQDEITPEIISSLIEWGKTNAEAFFTEMLHDVNEDSRGLPANAA